MHGLYVLGCCVDSYSISLLFPLKRGDVGVVEAVNKDHTFNVKIEKELRVNYKYYTLIDVYITRRSTNFFFDFM